MSHKVKLVVDGNEVEFDTDEELVISNVSEDQMKVSAQMAYWGQLQASAESEKLRSDAYYRTWRAKQGQVILDGEPKISEWKVKQAIEANPEFTKLKTALSQATYNALFCRNVFESFKIKANQLQSKGAMMRAELDATGMTTKKTTKETYGSPAKKKFTGVTESEEGKATREVEEGSKRTHMKKLFTDKTEKK